MIPTKDPMSLVTVSIVSFEEKLRSSSNLVVPCALMLQREKFYSSQEAAEDLRSLRASGDASTKAPRSGTECLK